MAAFKITSIGMIENKSIQNQADTYLIAILRKLVT